VNLVLALALALSAPDIKEWRLDNGLDVVYLGVHRTPIVTVQVWYHVGSKDEPRTLRGSAHMFEHMMFRGTSFVPPQAHAQMVARVGGRFDAQTREDTTFYAQTVPRQYLDLAVHLEADRMRNLLIRKEMVDAVRDLVKEERRGVEGSPIARALDRFRQLAFTRHPYGWLPSGYAEDLDRLRPSDLKRFYDTYYRPGNATLVVVGDVGEDEVRAAAQRWFGPLERGPEPPRPSASAAEPKQAKERKEVVAPSPVGVVICGWHTPPARSEDVYVLQVIANILGGGGSQRLHQRIVRRDRIGMFGGAEALIFEDPGLFFAIGAYESPEAGEKVAQALEEEAERLAREPVGEVELARARNQLAAQFDSGLQTVEGLAAQMGNSALLVGDPRQWLTDADRYRAVTDKDVMRVAKQYFVPENLTVMIAPPGGGK
jgi:zinc protease